MKSLTFFLFLFVFVFDVSIGVFKVHYDGHKLVRIIPRSPDTLLFLQKLNAASSSLELDFWSYPTRLNQAVDIRVPPHYIEELNAVLHYHNISSIILNNDLQRLLQKEYYPSNATSDLAYDFKYHPYSEILEEMQRLAQETNHAKLIDIGTSYEYRKIYAIKVFERERDVKPIVFLSCGLHAREWLSPATCMFLARHLLSNTTSLRQNYTWVILPVLNVDGYEYSFTTERFWRKSRSVGKAGCIGVDLNRNFNHHWSGVGTSENPCDVLYHGRHPFSEPETYSLGKYLLSHRKNIKVFLDIHSFGQLFMSPWGHTTRYSSHYKHTHEPMMRKVANAIASVHGKKFTYGPASIVIYPTSGDATDWVYAYLGVVHSYSIELRPTFQDERGFIVPPQQIVESGNEILNGINELVSNL